MTGLDCKCRVWIPCLEFFLSFHFKSLQHPWGARRDGACRRGEKQRKTHPFFPNSKSRNDLWKRAILSSRHTSQRRAGASPVVNSLFGEPDALAEVAGVRTTGPPWAKENQNARRTRIRSSRAGCCRRARPLILPCTERGEQRVVTMMDRDSIASSGSQPPTSCAQDGINRPWSRFNVGSINWHWEWQVDRNWIISHFSRQDAVRSIPIRADMRRVVICFSRA